LCRKNAKETTELCHKINALYAIYLKKASFNKEFLDITSYALDAIWYIDVTADKDAFLTFTYGLHGIPCKYLIFSLIKCIFISIINFELLFFL